VFTAVQNEAIAQARSRAAAFREGLAASEGCVDINDCGYIDEENPCKNAATCQDVGAGMFQCECVDGWTDSTCDVNVNECMSKDTNTCSIFANCIDKDPNVDGMQYECECKFGFAGDGETCTDVNDCVIIKDGTRHQRCAEHGFCTDQGAGFYTCKCDEGFHGQDCDMDVNECVTGDNKCGRNANCVNTDGAYECECKSGFAGDPTILDGSDMGCVDIDDCNLQNAPCKNGGLCRDMGLGSFVCECADGWSDARCDFDVNECAEGYPNECHKDSLCVNTLGSYECECLPGFTEESGGDGEMQCIDIDDCATDNGGCRNGATCHNHPGPMRTCDCAEGYKGCGDPFCETDCNECETVEPCHPSASCTVDPPLFSCQCNAEFYGDGFTCQECDTCADGYKQVKNCSPTSNRVCSNIDECAINEDNCAENAGCRDLPGSFECQCQPGYWGDGVQGQQGCTECTVCQAGFHETVPCTATSDRQCQVNLPTGDYLIESEAGAEGSRQCLAILRDEWFPTRVNYGNSDKFCGFAVPDGTNPLEVASSHAEVKWSLRALNNNEPTSDSELYTISHANMDSSTDGPARCMYFGSLGSDVYPTLTSCVDYEDALSCPWGTGEFCGYNPRGQAGGAKSSALMRKKNLIRDGTAVFKIKPVKMSEGKYIIMAMNRAKTDFHSCIAFEEQGAATHPSRYNWGNGDDWCGVGDWEGYGKEMALLNNKQAVFIFTNIA
jgi:hypothetical protein